LKKEVCDKTTVKRINPAKTKSYNYEDVSYESNL